MKKRYLFLIILCIVIVALFTIEPLQIAFNNQISLLHRKGYFIPKQSNLYKFKETKSSIRSGAYWLYGEDDTFYFYIGKCDTAPYSFIKKEDSKYSGFDKHSYITWQYCSLPTYQEGMQNEVLSCGDLLENFGLKKPKHLEYVNCSYNPKTQYITRAEYRVKGKYSKEIEAYFVAHFNMPPLKIFSHTGWEPSGYGSVKIKTLQNINPNYELMVEMWGNARRDVPESDPNFFSLLPRKEVPYFIVYVSVVSI